MAFDKERFLTAVRTLGELSNEKPRDEKGITEQEKIIVGEINSVNDYNAADTLIAGIWDKKEGIFWGIFADRWFPTLLKYASFSVFECLFKKMLEDDKASFLHPLSHDDGRYIKAYVKDADKCSASRMSPQELMRVKDFLGELNNEIPIYLATRNKSRSDLETHHILVRMRSKIGAITDVTQDISVRKDIFLNTVQMLLSGKADSQPQPPVEQEILRQIKELQGNTDPKLNSVAHVLSSADFVFAEGGAIKMQWSRAFFQYASYAMIKALFEKILFDESTFITLLIEYEGQTTLDRYCEDLGACGNDTRITEDERNHIKNLLTHLKNHVVPQFYIRRESPDSAGLILPLLNGCMKRLNREPSAAAPAPEQPVDAEEGGPKQDTNKRNPSIHPSRLSRLWHNHWRSILAVGFGILMIVLAFTPAGPAIAAALTLKAVLAPVFAWIAGLGATSIALGLGLLLSGFVLGLPSWILGMTLKAGALIVLAFNFINSYVIKLKEECINLCNDENGDFTVGRSLIFGLPILISWILEQTFTAIQLTFLCLAEFGSRTFRKLGAWQARLFNKTPAPDAEIGSDTNKKYAVMLPTPSRPLAAILGATGEEVPAWFRVKFFTHLYYLISKVKPQPPKIPDKTQNAASMPQESYTPYPSENREWSLDRDFIKARATWLFADFESTGQNPYDAAEENPAPSSISNRGPQ